MINAKILKKGIITMSDLTQADIELIIDTAESMSEISKRDIKKVPILRGKTIINLFEESSTRTKSSFEIAGKRLSADVINIAASSSSMQKGETLRDTILTLKSMKPDILVLRAHHSGAAELSRKELTIPVINAGDGRNEHPTQALLDLYTIRQRFGYLKGLNVLIIGDIVNSRVARSNIIALKSMGVKVTLCAPRTLLPSKIELLVDKVSTSLRDAIKSQDVVMALRIQAERIRNSAVGSLRDYIQRYQVNSELLKLSNKDVVIIHPGPVNRGIELESKLADSSMALILNQVENGISIRMALFYLLMGGAKLDKD